MLKGTMYQPTKHFSAGPLLLSLLAILALLTSPVIAAAPKPSIDSSGCGGCKPQVPITHYTAQQVVKQLGLIPNVEKGYYVESFRDPVSVNNRSASTAIYYLLEGSAGPSHWHRIDVPEVWHYYAGASLKMSLSHNDGKPVKEVVLGPNIFNCERPQVVVGKWEWQSAQSLGDWTLVGTTVAPGFDPKGFEMPAEGWQPKGA
ncbi:cupin superfamily protein [Histoplasma capsulatum var. duboisii H88]|uniref:Cupin superfamily protein n=2 Tax=Ajellomyces capsulatus (strain H88) TaxID=544711 RepID=A0A8A1L8W5_AJEC8|nr:cupin superfamily protein [Histoplasma capsulatum var. duboisii H88]